MVPGLKKVYAALTHYVDETMFLRQSTGPSARCQVFQGLGLTNTLERIAHNGIDQIESAQSHLPIRFNPITEVLQKLGLKDGRSSGRNRRTTGFRRSR